MYLVLFICFWKRVCCDCYIAAVFTEFWLVRYLHQVLWRKGIAYRNCIYGVRLILVVLNRGLVLDCYVAAMFTEFCLSCWCLHQVWRQMLLEQLMLISPVGAVPSTRYFTRRWGGWGALVAASDWGIGKSGLGSGGDTPFMIHLAAVPSGRAIPGLHPRLIQWSAHFRGNPWVQKIWWDECGM